MSHTLKHTFSAAILAASAWSLSDPAYASVGDTVTNIATVTYTAGGVEGELSTNPAIFTIRAPDITPTIEFFRHAPNAGDTISVAINGSSYSPAGDLSGPFTSIGPARTTGGRIIDTSGPLPLTPAEVYLTGELMLMATRSCFSFMSQVQIQGSFGPIYRQLAKTHRKMTTSLQQAIMPA